MSRRNKLLKFAEVAGYSNVYESFDVNHASLTCCGEQLLLSGKWAEQHFQNALPITLELACGKGEYTLGLATKFADRNVIGVDIKGARIWKGARRALQQGLPNAAFLRTRIERLNTFFAPREIAEIWIVFPDPFPRESKANRRLTSQYFLDVYRNVLTPGGVVHLKTDDDNLYAFTLEVIAADDRCKVLYHDSDIYAKTLPLEELDIKTFYEVQHLAAGKKIKYVRFNLG
jgi:tRNA (guanine-N7-)-methyltransferase